MRAAPALIAPIMLGVALAMALGVVAGCGDSRIPEAARLSKDPGEQATLDRGRSLYVTRCGGCHALYEPSILTPAEWPATVKTMRKRSNITVEEADLVTRYVVAAAGLAAK